MITPTIRRTAFCNTAEMVLMLSVLWLSPLPAPADELSEVPAALPPTSLSLADLGGQQRSLNEFAGKVLLVNFWASWCTPCMQEMPSIQRLAEAMREKPFAVIGVNVAEAQRRVRTVVERLGIEFPVLLDKDSAMFKAWGANVLPTTYVLDGRGRARYVGHGPMEWDRVDIVDMLERLAAERRPGGE
jgi:thiol-disulfide isomerase/thioredoxin